MIQVENLYFAYSNQQDYILKDINFSVVKGEKLVILGTSGCGKSTLVRIIDGMITNYEGKITVNQKNIGSLDNKSLLYYRRHDISMVFQNYALLPHLSVEENVALGLRIRKYKRNEYLEMITPYIKLVGLERWRKSSISQLSGGMKQRVGIARALANKSPILIMDEPFSGLDPITRYEMNEEILRIQEELSITLLFITHDVREASKIGDHILLMNRGCVEQYGEPEELFEHPATPYVKEFITKGR